MRSARMRRATRILLASWLVSGCGAPKASFPPISATSASPSTATDSLHLRVAAKAVVSAADIAQVWPGFWSEEQAFAFWPYLDGVLVILPTPPIPPHLVAVRDPALPRVLDGIAFYQQGRVETALEGHFNTAFVVGDRTLPAVGKMALPPGYPRDVEAMQLAYLVHETFHKHQQSAFADRDGWGALAEPFIDPMEVSDAEFRARMAVERRILAAALASENIDSVRTLAGQYLSIRTLRLTRLPMRARAEALVERKEGSAELVGLQAAAAALGSRGWLKQTLRENLLEPILEENQFLPDRYKSQLYATGAAIGMLLDRMGVDWRLDMQQGASFPELLVQAVGSPLADSAAETAIMARYGHDELRDRFDDHVVIDVGAAFAAYAGPVVIIRGVLVTSTRYSGIRDEPGPGVGVFQPGTTVEINGGGVRIESRGLHLLLDQSRRAAEVTAQVGELPLVDDMPPRDGSIVQLQGVRLEGDALTVAIDRPLTLSVGADTLTIDIE